MEHHLWVGLRPFQRHSLVLMVAGGVYILIGVSYLLSDPTPQRIAALKYAVMWIDYNHWGYAFIAVGTLAFISSRWPPVSETWGYFVLTGQSSAWGLFYLTGVLFGHSPSANLSAALSWGLIAFMWWAISALINPHAIDHLLSKIISLQAENLELHRELYRVGTIEVARLRAKEAREVQDRLDASERGAEGG